AGPPARARREAGGGASSATFALSSDVPLRSAPPPAKREEIDGRGVADLAGTRLIPPRFARRQARLRRSVARQPEVSGVGEEPGALRRDRGHARPFVPPLLGRP